MTSRVLAFLVALGFLGAGCGLQPGPTNAEWDPANPSRQIVIDVFSKYGPGEVECALRIVRRESGFVAEAENIPGQYRGAKGLWQILVPLHDWRYLQLGYAGVFWWDPEVNTHVAEMIWLEQGWGPWGGCR